MACASSCYDRQKVCASEFLIVIAIARAFLCGHSKMSARSRRACIGFDRHLTFCQSRSRVSGTEGCPSHISSGSSIWTVSRPQPGSTLALAMEEFCTMACGRYGSLLRCRVCPMAVQPIYAPLVEEERVGGWELEGHGEFEGHREFKEGA